MRWAGNMARMGEARKVYTVLLGKSEGKRSLEDQGVDGMMGSEWILGRLVVLSSIDTAGNAGF
jgi:hypothetical protein